MCSTRRHYVILSLIWNRRSPESLQKITFYYLASLLVDVMISVVAFAFEKERFNKLLLLIPQRFFYRQLMYVIFLKAIRKAIKGETQGWGVLKRTGHVNQIASLIK